MKNRKDFIKEYIKNNLNSTNVEEAINATFDFCNDFIETKDELPSEENGFFNSIDEIHFYFEYSGENSFCGFHQEGDEMTLTLIDVFLKKKGYLEPKTFYELFDNTGIKLPEIIYKGSLTQEFIKSINENDWTKPDCLYPIVKEGVVCKRTTMLKGQRLPMVKVKTNWWINKLKEKYPNNWKELE